MSLHDQPPRPEEPGDGSRRRLAPTRPGVVTAWAVVGLVGGWLLRPLGESWWGHAPIVSWAQPLLLLMAAAILGFTAWSTWRQVHVHHIPLEPHRAVNRLVLARACALVGALVAGGYLGYAVSWIGMDHELATQRLIRSVIAGVAGIGICAGALLLERACRVRDPEDGGDGADTSRAG
ncbi:DUF3180 domain-containing protein [Nocardioides insulae]|uniref:DUF3180 domain-containing protein n=1 Tax=Nocardioides insulae TaxID=394734 RepID=UPI00041EAABC|nr:DUF3180 domain-containing protein [Nocardioides insulae]